MDEIATSASPETNDAPIVLDLRGLKCPMPVLHTRKALRRIAVGRSLRVFCTDPLAGIDIPNFVREDGHLLAETMQVEGVSAFVIVKQAL